MLCSGTGGTNGKEPLRRRSDGGLSVRSNKMDALARRLADFLGESASAAPRGVIEFPSLGCVAAFGNDGHARDSRVRREVELIRLGLPTFELDVLGFGLSARDQHTWAMIVNAEPGNYRAVSNVIELVWCSWARAVAEPQGRAPRIDWRQVTIAEDAIDRAQHCPAWTFELAARGLISPADTIRDPPGDRPSRRAKTRAREETGGFASSGILSIEPCTRTDPEAKP